MIPNRKIGNQIANFEEQRRAKSFEKRKKENITERCGAVFGR